ncbi:hypothetical protein QVD17_31260 [Tagetes erecta]|uniref:Transmembrane protein n=1 Tax=Tagetes erecta TaxID=13708 RepID=A0AAD8K580_TARER|nr:hypothetical protein QVD17_31260 [Tagetes erecta]
MVASDIRWYGGYGGDCSDGFVRRQTGGGGCWLLIVNLVVWGFYQRTREDDGLKGFDGAAMIMVVVLVSDEMIDGFYNSGVSWWLLVKW